MTHPLATALIVAVAAIVLGLAATFMPETWDDR